MSEVIPEIGCVRVSAEDRAETQREREVNLQVIQRGDLIKPGWWHWRCRRQDGCGDVAYGYVEADALGRAVAAETFEKDRF